MFRHLSHSIFSFTFFYINIIRVSKSITYVVMVLRSLCKHRISLIKVYFYAWWFISKLSMIALSNTKPRCTYLNQLAHPVTKMMMIFYDTEPPTKLFFKYFLWTYLTILNKFDYQEGWWNRTSLHRRNISSIVLIPWHSLQNYNNSTIIFLFD